MIINDLLKYFAGIDVAKEKFDCCISIIDIIWKAS